MACKAPSASAWQARLLRVQSPVGFPDRIVHADRRKNPRRRLAACTLRPRRRGDRMSVHPVSLDAPIISGPGAPAISAVGTSLVVHEWTGSGPSYMHVHRSDDEAWHVLEGLLRFRFADGEVDAPAGTTVFVPAGSPHAYWE